MPLFFINSPNNELFTCGFQEVFEDGICYINQIIREFIKALANHKNRSIPLRSSPAKITVVCFPQSSTSVSIRSVTAPSLYTTSDPSTVKIVFQSEQFPEYNFFSLSKMIQIRAFRNENLVPDTYQNQVKGQWNICGDHLPMLVLPPLQTLARLRKD